MSQQLTLELSDEVYEALQRQANAGGVSITEWIMTALSQQSIAGDEDSRSESQQQAARSRFRNHAGAVRLGYATGADNESIDIDIANTMDWQTRITLNPDILVSKPIIKGTRLAVEFIIDLLAQGWSTAEILRNYPGVTLEDIQACLSYATASLKAEKVYVISG